MTTLAPIAILPASRHIGVAVAPSSTPTGSNIPAGGIIMYSGLLSALDSTQWALCDGTRGTPNLVNSFIRAAANQSEIGDIGGSDTHSHTFTGTPDTTGSTSAGTPSGTNSIPTFTGNLD